MEPGAWRFALGRAVDQDVLLLGGQLLKRRLEIDLVPFGRQVNQLQQVLR